MRPSAGMARKCSCLNHSYARLRKKCHVRNNVMCARTDGPRLAWHGSAYFLRTATRHEGGHAGAPAHDLERRDEDHEEEHARDLRE